MCNANAEPNTIHPFEAAGLGLAPFKLIGFDRKVGPIKMEDGTEVGAPGQPMGTCDFCGTGIADCYRIKSSDLKTFVVGCDCVLKLGRSDNRLVGEVKRKKLALDRAKRAAKREAKWLEFKAEREATLQAEREANGGLTNAEIKAKAEAEALAAKAEQTKASNQWIIDALIATGQSGPFVQSMIAELGNRPFAELSPRCRQIIGEIYSKRAGRMGSKAYDAAMSEFEARTGA